MVIVVLRSEASRGARVLAVSLLEAMASLVNDDTVGVAVPDVGGVIVEGDIFMYDEVERVLRGRWNVIYIRRCRNGLSVSQKTPVLLACCGYASVCRAYPQCLVGRKVCCVLIKSTPS